MKKRGNYNWLLCSLLFISFSISIQAQWDLGLQSGIHQGKLRYYFDDEFIFKSDKVIGVDLGFFIKRELKSGFKLLSEIGFIQKGGKITEPLSPATYKFNEIDFSLLVTYEFEVDKFILFVGGGGYIGYILNGTAERRDIEFGEDGWNRKDIGITWKGGVGYNFEKTYLFLESNYFLSLNKIFDQQLEDFHLSMKSVGIGLNLGYGISF